jgi:arylsulfatase
MKSCLLPGIAGLAAMAAAACSTGKAGRGEKPNIIFILADDLGYNDLSCYGQKIIETPNLDSLASKGIRFTRYYSGSPVSAPSRCVLLTGLHSGHGFIRGNHEWPERGDVWNFSKMEEDPRLEGQFPIPANTLTIGSVLKKTGYMTACIGKWGLGAPFSEGSPDVQGFDLFYGYYCQRQAHTYFPSHLWRNREKVGLRNVFVTPHSKELDGTGDPEDNKSYARYRQKDYSPDLMISEAIRFIRSARDKPFFLYYTPTLPHVPLQGPEEMVERYHRKIGEEKPYTGDRGYFPCRYPMATYAAMVSALDLQVGILVRELRRQGMLDNTLIIFSSDNGPVTTGGASSEFFGNALPFNEAPDRLKGTVFEGGIRVPLIISWQGTIRPGVSDHLCAAWDFFPTLCEAAGTRVPRGLDGISLLPLLSGREVQKEHPFLYWEFPEQAGQQAVRTGNWKGIRDSTKTGNMRIRLFNLENDLREENDVAAGNPEVVSRIEAIMAAEHQRPQISRFDIFPGSSR